MPLLGSNLWCVSCNPPPLLLNKTFGFPSISFGRTVIYRKEKCRPYLKYNTQSHFDWHWHGVSGWKRQMWWILFRTCLHYSMIQWSMILLQVQIYPITIILHSILKPGSNKRGKSTVINSTAVLFITVHCNDWSKHHFLPWLAMGLLILLKMMIWEFNWLEV